MSVMADFFCTDRCFSSLAVCARPVRLAWSYKGTWHVFCTLYRDRRETWGLDSVVETLAPARVQTYASGVNILTLLCRKGF
jgi:hypothetical protein